MKKIFLTIIFILTVTPLSPAAAAVEVPVKSLSGRILLQSESNDRVWYVEPVTFKRYDLQDSSEVVQIIRDNGLGITDKNLAKIPTAKGQVSDKKLVNRLKGRILIQKEQNGEAWYVDPVDGLRYLLGDGQSALNLLKAKGLEVKNKVLAKIPMNDTQLIQDPFYNGLAYVRYDGVRFSGASHADQVLALASLSKLMTALVILDTNPVWDQRIVLTSEEIGYPKVIVGGDATSEVNLAAGDNVSFNDLWVAMLVASSNQAAITLADSTGLSRADFVSRMNIKARDLGLSKTVFYEPTGLDYRNVTTAKEMAKLAYAAFNRQEIVEAGKHKDYSISTVGSTTNKIIKVIDRNYSLTMMGVDASKTGYLIEAQRTAAVKKNGAIMVVMHALSLKQRNSTIEKLIKL